MFVAIFHPVNKTDKEVQFTLSASEAERLIRDEYVDSYRSRSNGSQRQLTMTTVAGNKISIVEPACQSLCLDLLKTKQHK